MKTASSVLLAPLLLTSSALLASASPSGYRMPPPPIRQILDTPPTPGISISPDRSTIAFLGREGLPPIARLAEPELRLAGIRINPRTNGPSRTSYLTSLTLDTIDRGQSREVSLPSGAQISHFQWSPDSSQAAFANTVDNGIELWVVDARTATARRLLGPELNACIGSPFEWAPDNRSLIVRRVLPDRGAPPAAPHVPGGPIVQDSIGRAAPVRTNPDLLRSPHDEQLFDYYFTAQIGRIPAAGGNVAEIGEPGIYSGTSVSPNGSYVLVYRIKRPYSYLTTLAAFPAEMLVLDAQGKQAHVVYDRREITVAPIGRDMVLTEPRAVQWRSDAPATLVWAEAADGGDARSAAAVRDRVLMLDAPFRGQPRTVIELDQRYSGIHWGRADLALVDSRWMSTARTKTYVINPGQPRHEPRLLWDRSSEARYDDPGSPLTTLNETGNRVLQFAPGGNAIYLSGQGASPQGNYPFLDRLELSSGQTDRLWQAEDPYYESLVTILDPGARRMITRRETQDDPPNYFLRDAVQGTLRALTDFPDPAPQMAGIQRRIITYPREDGITLSATLFTPPGYDEQRDPPLPLLLWAYPREFRDAAAAGQISDSPNRFSRPTGSSHLFLLTQGYAILDGPAMPIIGEGDVEPNDTYVEQLVASAKAAIDKVVEMGVADRDRIAVGGHSYGGFMAANLLAHSDLFRAGIARSAAFNRTLTPFGFQAERRFYWDASEIYLQMSPFHNAKGIRDPLLLIHGQADNNEGTYTIQSERMYQALNGLGATARLVLLPHESHGYVARESVLHVLAEMIEWMDRYVKSAPGEPRAVSSPVGAAAPF